MSHMFMRLLGVCLALALASCGNAPQTTTLPSTPPRSAELSPPAPAVSEASSEPAAAEPSPSRSSVSEVSSGTNPEQASTEGASAGSAGPVQGGMGAGMCVETYSPESLKHRAFAFDGTVTAIELRDDPSTGGGGEASKLPWVTFKINQWYTGGSGSEIGVWMQGIQTSDRSLPIVSTGSIPADIGTRLLVAGEAIGVGAAPEQWIAWSCGFTQPYTPDAAAEWQSATQ